MPAKKINLLPQTDFDQTLLGKFLRWSLTYGRYIIVCTEIVVLLAFIFRFSLDRKITDLKEEIDQKSAIIAANQEFEFQFRALQERVDLVHKNLANNDYSVSVLKHLEKITPQGIKLTSITFEPNKLILAASTDTNSNLALFLNQLKTSSMFSNINVTAVSKKTTGTSDTTFQIEAALVSVN